MTLSRAVQLIIVCIVIGGSVPHAAESESPALIPHAFEARFENGHIDGWASYPPFEDTAYDPTLIPGRGRPAGHLQPFVTSGEYYMPADLAPPPEPAGNEYYLLRSYRPNSPSSQSLGMMHKLSMYTQGDSELRFDYWQKLSAAPTEIAIELAGVDGLRYRHVLSRAVFEQWQTVRLPLRAFKCDGKSIPEGLKIEMVGIINNLERGDPGTIHRFAIDNVVLTGARRAGFRVTTPETADYEQWEIDFSLEHLLPGETLDIEAASEIALESGRVRLVDYEGNELAAAALSGGGSEWSAEDLFEMEEASWRGPARLELTGRTADGTIARQDVRLWMMNEPKPGRHPRLFFAGDDRNWLRERTQEEPFASMWNSIRRRAERAREEIVPERDQIEEYPPETLLQQRQGYGRMTRNIADDALLNAFVWFIDGDEEAGQFARDALIKQAGYEQWIHPSFLTRGTKMYLYAGHTILYTGVTYDLVYSLMNEEERARVRQGLIRNGIANCFEEYVLNDQIPNNTSNHISWETASAAVALLAMQGEIDGGDARVNGEPYLSGLLEKEIRHFEATHLDDGSYGEGYSYQRYSIEGLISLLAALDHIHDVSTLAESLLGHDPQLYGMYIEAGGNHHLLDMGDVLETRRPSPIWAWLAPHLDNPLIQHFYEELPGDEWMDLLWYDPDFPSRDPAETLPPGRIFDIKGNAVFRTGWDADAAVLNFRAGPNYNHTHMDQGNFLFWGWGEELVSEGKRSDYYTDPYYWSYFIQTAAHNTILVDDNPESQFIGDFLDEAEGFDRFAEIDNALAAGTVNWVTSELAPIYRAAHEQLTRTLYFIDPGYVVVRDVIRSASGPHTYQWQLIPPDRESLEIEGEAARIRRGDVAMHIAVLEPRQHMLQREWAPIPIREYEDYPETELQPRARLQVTHEEPREMQEFLVALLPDRAGFTGAGDAQRIEDEDFEGATLAFEGGSEDTMLFAREGSMIEHGELRTDGRSAWMRRDAEGRVAAVSAEQATELRLRSFRIQSSQPVNVALKMLDQATWRVTSDRPDAITVEAAEGILIERDGAAISN